jgi:predicted MPP superfamily phosphohydrolase
MRKRTFIIFFSIVLSIYGLINFYIFTAGLRVLHQFPELKFLYIIIYLFLALSFIAGRFLERVFLNKFTSFLVWIGSLWLGAMVYFFFFVLLIDFIRLINLIIPFISIITFTNHPDFSINLGYTVITVVGIIILFGYINSVHPRIKNIELTIHKKSPIFKSITIAAASDIHLGTIISKSRLQRIVNKINGLNADIVLFPGDIVDEDIGPVIRHNLGEILKNINARIGVFGITGNHEYIGGVEKACKYLEEHRIFMLRDSYVKINNAIYIAGREDRSIKGFTGKLRKPLDEILDGVDKNLPIIMMDHQPIKLNEAVENNIDLQLSGHTHHGQLWPFNFITKKVYELSYGYLKKENTNFYVSCGAGTWGPPVRTGTRPEIINLRLTFA